MTIRGGRRLFVGAGCFVNTGVVFDCVAEIQLGENVHIGHGAKLLTPSHRTGPARQRAGELTAAPIFVGDGVWVGADAVVLPGVTIGAGCVIAAGAVVTRICEPNGLYGGVPAVRLHDLK